MFSAHDAPLSGASVFVLSDEDRGGETAHHLRHIISPQGGGNNDNDNDNDNDNGNDKDDEDDDYDDDMDCESGMIGGGRGPSTSSLPPGGGLPPVVAVVDPDTLGAAVAALGGRRVDVLDEATHALWAPSGGSGGAMSGSRHQPRFREEVDVMLRDMLASCRSLNLPVVDATWLDRMAALRAGEHWSDVDVSPYVPAVVALVFGDEDGAASTTATATTSNTTATTSTATTAASSTYPDCRTFDGGRAGLSWAGGGVAHGIPAAYVPMRAVDDGWNEVMAMDTGVAVAVAVGDDIHPSIPAQPKAPRYLPASVRGFAKHGYRRDASVDLSTSICETYGSMVGERPEAMEEDAIRRAVELSLLDCALILRPGKSHGALLSSSAGKGDRPPHDVLRLKPGASKDEVRKAYRKRALETHPDKGGEPGEFEAVACAYRSLLDDPDRHHSSTSLENGGGDDATPAEKIKTTAHWDKELQEHRNLVRELFQAHGADVDSILAKQSTALERLGLRAKEAGSMGRNERDEVIRNSCFYLSLAVSYLSGIGALTSLGYNPRTEDNDVTMDGERNIWDDDNDDDNDDDDALLRKADEALIHETALQLKRIIEAAVVAAHPEWAVRGLVGEEVQAFSDFLVYVLASPTLVSDWAVAVFDAASGFVDVYKGKNFPEDDVDWARSNTLTLRYEPGHYQPILPLGTRERPALGEILESLAEAEVIYVITDGSA